MSLLLRLEVALAKSLWSTSNVRYPRAAASTAVPRPVAPPPITRTSQSAAAVRICLSDSLRFTRFSFRQRGPVCRQTPAHVLQRDLGSFVEFGGAHIPAGRLAQTRHLSADGLVISCQLGDQLLGLRTGAFQDLLRITARRGELAVAVPIDPDGIGRGEDAWCPDPRTGLI